MGTCISSTPVAARSEASPAKSSLGDDSAPGTGNRKRILILEDHVGLADMLKLILHEEGFEVVTTALGMEALRLLAEQPASFHLAIVDIDLPDMEGFDAMASARSAGWLSGTRIIFYCGDPGPARVTQAGRFPGSVFIAKPFGIADLLSQIQIMLACRISS